MKAAELEELGRRAVACPRWRWMPGMTILGSKGRRVVVIGLSGAPEATSGMNSRAIEPDELPDLSSPATLGCLLALVREAHEDADIVAFVVHSYGSPERWCVDVGPAPDLHDERKYVYRPTEAEALVAALEAAP